MDIRIVTQENLKEVVPLFNAYREFYGQPSDLAGAEQFLTERFTNRESIIFLASIHEQPVGFVQLYPSFSSVAMKKAFILNDLFVTAQARQQGVAKSLIERCYVYCEEQNARYITLETAVDNKNAQRLYEQMEMQVDTTVLHYSKYW
ncbi:GNAT family N-acetyltransferase [Lysinibacillus piscis]|uniref:N-acetyltransferase YhfO n=1 Tax=Lysinibacillus piscis TaxID=2518931 RepID=A0ABQ5NKL6_9BACI|nr:GNAT family N-acetyltransferase [Lysinibacillus sp. KH24]GLC88847.1 putative N-acetyltransferase YhfO [Lysinibacillus sp. KH24]